MIRFSTTVACILILSTGLFVNQEAFALDASAQTSAPTYCLNTLYRNALYAYLKGNDDYNAQIDLMKAYFSDAEKEKKQAMPGAYAHMGLLFYKIRNLKKAVEYLNMEKSIFPESAGYIDSVLKSWESRGK